MARQQNAANRNIVDTTPVPPEIKIGDAGIVDVTGDEEIIIPDDDDLDPDDIGFSELEGGPMTTTQNFMGGAPVIVNEVQDTGIRIVEGTKVMRVRVIEDIGPVFYGDDIIELKKGRLYEVPEHIHEYLRTRDKLWEQQ